MTDQELTRLREDADKRQALWCDVQVATRALYREPQSPTATAILDGLLRSLAVNYSEGDIEELDALIDRLKSGDI